MNGLSKMNMKLNKCLIRNSSQVCYHMLSALEYKVTAKVEYLQTFLSNWNRNVHKKCVNRLFQRHVQRSAWDLSLKNICQWRYNDNRTFIIFNFVFSSKHPRLLISYSLLNKAGPWLSAMVYFISKFRNLSWNMAHAKTLNFMPFNPFMPEAAKAALLFWSCFSK